ncbi:MAG: hypothetical protein LBH16_05760 [Treponema sp.]|jgi:hypothetical protein|nr:hypothetical protein [Treponema sp.]
MRKKPVFLSFLIIMLVSSCSSISAVQPWEEAGRWNIYGFRDPEQKVLLNDFYNDFDSEKEKYRTESLFWYHSAVRDNKSVNVFLESETVYLGQAHTGIELCRPEDLEGLNTNEKPSGTIVMNVPNLEQFTKGLEKYSVLKIKYRYFYRPVYAVKGQEPASVSNRTVSQAETMGIMSINEFFLDEYEITGKINVPPPPPSQFVQGIQRAGDILGAVVRGTDRAIGRLLGIDDVNPQGEMTLNGQKYQKAALGEIAKNSATYTGPDLLLTSRVKLKGDRGGNIWAFRESDGNLVQTMKYTGHIPSSMKEIRIYYRLLSSGSFEIDEWKQASIFNDQW